MKGFITYLFFLLPFFLIAQDCEAELALAYVDLEVLSEQNDGLRNLVLEGVTNELVQEYADSVLDLTSTLAENLADLETKFAQLENVVSALSLKANQVDELALKIDSLEDQITVLESRETTNIDSLLETIDLNVSNAVVSVDTVRVELLDCEADYTPHNAVIDSLKATNTILLNKVDSLQNIIDTGSGSGTGGMTGRVIATWVHSFYKDGELFSYIWSNDEIPSNASLDRGQQITSGLYKDLYYVLYKEVGEKEGIVKSIAMIDDLTLESSIYIQGTESSRYRIYEDLYIPSTINSNELFRVDYIGQDLGSQNLQDGFVKIPFTGKSKIGSANIYQEIQVQFLPN